MTRPLLYEINTRCWLRQLSERFGRAIHLGNVPDGQLDSWKRMGFTHVWLMGVWTTGPRSREQFLSNPDTPQRLREVLPDWREEDVTGSPYAIAAYTVPESLGGEGGLQHFRERLHSRGIRLLLDFVPNHVGLDHPWVTGRPELFVQSPVAAPGTFRHEITTGPRWLAHGKDPFFPVWNDTVQLDVRREDTRAAVVEELQAVAARCDGVRCDMAMLLLEDVFSRNWQSFPCAGHFEAGEFWDNAIASVKQHDFLFIAEVYWDLEERLQQLGFDYTYDKRVTDLIVERDPAELQKHLQNKSPEFIQRSVHFLENHDEPRIAGRLSLPEHRAAALLTLTLPGMCLIYEGQLTGARTQLPVHLGRWPVEPVNTEIALLYERLLAPLPRTAVGRGNARLLRPLPVSPEDDTAECIVVVQWQGDGEEFDLAVMNFAPASARCHLMLTGIGLAGKRLSIADWLGDPSRSEWLDQDASGRSFLELPPHAARLLHCRPVLEGKS